MPQSTPTPDATALASPNHALQPRAPTFNPFQGLSALWFAFSFLRRAPGGRRAAAVPTIIAACVTLCLAWLSFRYAGPALATLAEGLTGTFGEIVQTLLDWLGSLLATYLSLQVALLITPPLSAPALEKLVALTENELQLPPRPKMSFWREFMCGLQAQLLGLALTLPLALTLWLLGLLVPPFSVVAAALSSVLLALGVAWNLLDYPLSLRGIPARQRLVLFRRHPITTLSFGATLAALFWIPGLGVLLLPVGAVAATRVLWQHMAQPPETEHLTGTRST